MRARDLAAPDFLLPLQDRKVRDQERLYLAEGLRALHAALDHGAPVRAIAYCRELLHSGEVRRLIHSLDCPKVKLSEEAFRRLAQNLEPQGVLLALDQDWRGLPDKVRRGDLWLGVERVNSPGNLGTLIRSAHAAGASGLIVFGPPRDRADPYDPATVRASMGSIFAVPIIQTTHQAFRKWPRRYEIRVLGADGGAATAYRKVNLRKPTLIMLGNERQGLSEAQRLTCDAFVRIPMAKGIDSLNIAMAGTLLLYEAVRGR